MTDNDGTGTRLGYILWDMQMDWQIIVFLGTGLALGFGLTLLFQRFRKPRSQVELEAEHKKLQEDVMEHFVTTANLVNDMTDSYKAVFDHLNEGATRLVDGAELRERLPLEDARVVTLSRIGHSDATQQPDQGPESSVGSEEQESAKLEPEEDPEPPRF